MFLFYFKLSRLFQITFNGLHEIRPTSDIRKTYCMSDKAAMEYKVINNPYYDRCLSEYLIKRGVCPCRLRWFDATEWYLYLILMQQYYNRNKNKFSWILILCIFYLNYWRYCIHVQPSAFSLCPRVPTDGSIKNVN